MLCDDSDNCGPQVDPASLDDDALAQEIAQTERLKARSLTRMRRAQHRHQHARQLWEQLTQEAFRRRLDRADDPVAEALALAQEDGNYPALGLVDEILERDVAEFLPDGSWNTLEHHAGNPDCLTPTLQARPDIPAHALAAGVEALITRWSALVTYPEDVLFHVLEDTLSEQGTTHLRWNRLTGRTEVLYRDYYSDPHVQFAGTLPEAIDYLTVNFPYTLS